MIAFRVFPHDTSAPSNEPGGSLWFPREWQGTGRHDNPEHYGCLYVSEVAVAPVAEALAVFRGTAELRWSMLVRAARGLALATIELDDGAMVIDLDDPEVLLAEKLRPSQVATRQRERTQADALTIFKRHREAAGLRWWSTLEASWLNLTLFDRAAARLNVADIRLLALDDPVVLDAADALGIRVAA